MCGIAGFIDFRNRKEESRRYLSKMTNALSHRGPDASGEKLIISGNALIGLGHRRLSIIDLSDAGVQPMTFKHLSIVYNGEIYNYSEIRDVLIAKGHRFKSDSDTEVILHAYDEWGTGCVEKFIGMFSFVLVDELKQKVIFFRDRAGVKPLYMYEYEGLLLFSSELKAFHEHKDFKKEIDQSSLMSYFDYGYISAPRTIFKHTTKHSAGAYTSIDLIDGKRTEQIYWDAKSFYLKPKTKLVYEEAKEQLHSLMKSAFSYRMVADVPVGVFLSGGYDSTAVAAILQKMQGNNKLKTFTIGFEQGNNEAPAAKETAAYLGTEHTEYYCTQTEAQEIIPTLPYYYDEPFADSSAIPTILVSRMARKAVTVALSADAGDELFAGYSRYPNMFSHLKQSGLIPAPLKQFAKSLAKGVSRFTTNTKPDLKHKLQSISKSLNANSKIEASLLYKYSHSLPDYYRNNLFKKASTANTTHFDDGSEEYLTILDRLLSVDYRMYLQDDILTKVDRATMSVSLEGREPLLDHRLLEFAATLPDSFKMGNGVSKRILKDIVHEYVPEQMMNRPKAGFSLPIYSWLRNELSYLIDEHLSEKALAESDLFNVEFVTHLVTLFKSNKLYYSPLIWKLLMFQMWHKRWM